MVTFPKVDSLTTFLESRQYDAFPPAIAKKTALEALKKTSLEWTAVYNGFFLDYFGTPRIKSYMDDVAFFVDLANNFASIPGSGNVPVVFTHTSDVARFIAEFLEHPNWRSESYIIGDRVTFNEIVRMAEDVKGQFTMHEVAFGFLTTDVANTMKAPGSPSSTTLSRVSRPT